MSRAPSQNGALWTLLGAAALAAGASLVKTQGARARRRRPVEEGPLPYSASARIVLSCSDTIDDEEDDLEYDWEPGDDFPDDDDLEREATRHFESRGEGFADLLGQKNCRWEIEVKDVDVTPGWSMVPTPRGPKAYLT